MFLNWMFKDVSDEDKSKIIEPAKEQLKLSCSNGTSWSADYRRIRISAVKKQKIAKE